ncbi:MAG: SHOCT domain-containing protein [Actinomycetes bacterium]
MRKALFFSTLGMSRAAGIRTNSKKDRTANALEKQNRMMGRQQRTIPRPQQAGPLHAVTCPSCSATVHLPYGDHQRCPSCRKPMRVFPLPLESAKTAVKDSIGDLERLAKLRGSGDLTDEEFAAAKARILSGDTGTHI